MNLAGAQRTVFISYAHETDDLRAQVKALADWLSARGCTVLSDHRYASRPPAEGWQAWMLDCIRAADTVLVVCTPKLKFSYEGNDVSAKGRGLTYEGAIVTQHIYDNYMKNTKFFPILPDNGSCENIPITLRQWWNNHKFPSGYMGILELIKDEAIMSKSRNLEVTANNISVRHSRIKKDFDSIDKGLYVDGAFQSIRNYFQVSCTEINQHGQNLFATFDVINGISFTCTVVNRNKKDGEAHITVHNCKGQVHSLSTPSISISYRRYSDGSTSNGYVCVESDGYSLFLTLNLLFEFHGARDQKFSPEQVASMMWDNFVRRAGIEYEQN